MYAGLQKREPWKLYMSIAIIEINPFSMRMLEMLSSETISENKDSEMIKLTPIIKVNFLTASFLAIILIMAQQTKSWSEAPQRN